MTRSRILPDMGTSSAQRSASEAASQFPSWASVSIYETARRHCRERILVQPLQWTSRHLELLQCSFTDPRPAPPTAQSNFTGDRDGRKYMRHFFVCTYKYVGRECSIRALLASPECPLEWRTDLSLRLHDCPLVTLPCTAFFLRDESESESAMLARPIAAHIERGHITTLRMNTLRSFTSSRHNPPVDAIRSIKWKNLVPSEPLHDPYIAALLIALAQQRRKMLDRGVRPRDKAGVTEWPFKVLCTNEDKEIMQLYSANIPSSLLDKFDYPSVPPPEPTSISIQITCIYYKPLETLRDRLLALILPATDHDRVEKKRKMVDEDEDKHLCTRHTRGDSITCI
ncbi:Uncharacterized protein TCAP_02464 [Tolypocladium capitatum]|uniref:Uncharacterized protein n=1 Tax=Tolypocladium capitatum TaxID=45235 RepID=A0A2K3QJB6_9HYPO|nr:Uncharacterized protein TCAP_02464 [Tolypocladium capitatum]